MSEGVTQLGGVPDARLRSLIFPREHGAWGMLLVPLLTGGCIALFQGGRLLPLFLLTMVAVALFWMRAPAESWLGASPLRAQTSRERRATGLAIITLAIAAGLGLAELLWGGANPVLLLFGGFVVAGFALQAILKKSGRQMRMPAQMVGAVALTATAPAAYYVVGGQLDSVAWVLWAVNWLFACDQIHFVQLRIHAARAASWPEKLRRGRTFLFGEMLLPLALFLAWRLGVLPGLAALAFLPILFRGAIWFMRPSRPLVVRRLGWTEFAHAVSFAALLVAGFHWGR